MSSGMATCRIWSATARLIHADLLWLPHALFDRATRMAQVPLASLPEALLVLPPLQSSPALIIETAG